MIVPKDIGGSFGIKSSLFPYMTVVGLLAMRAGRPVKWIEDRAEHLIALQPPARPRRHARAGADEGRRDHRPARQRGRQPRRLRPRARAGDDVPPARQLRRAVPRPHVELHLVDVVSNKVPTGPNRGYGCQQVYLETERTLDEAALRLGLDPAEIRRRNLIPADAFPYETPTGGLYDSGDYPRVLELALETAGYDELRAMQAEARCRGAAGRDRDRPRRRPVDLEHGLHHRRAARRRCGRRRATTRSRAPPTGRRCG